MDQKISHYHVYVFRMWRVSECGGYAWRVSLERFDSNIRVDFFELTAFIGFLCWQTNIAESEELDDPDHVVGHHNSEGTP